jgi:hypothetical protein
VGEQALQRDLSVQEIIECAVLCSGALVPMLAVWAVFCLFTVRSGYACHATEVLFFLVLLLVVGLTVRTMMTDGACWLVHTASLGTMIVAGVMRRPAAQAELGCWEGADLNLSR